MDGENSSIEQTFRAIQGNPVWCRTCLNQNGEPPWANKPNKGYCIAFPREEGIGKPSNVFFDGEECPYYRGSDERARG